MTAEKKKRYFMQDEAAAARIITRYGGTYDSSKNLLEVPYRDSLLFDLKIKTVIEKSGGYPYEEIPDTECAEYQQFIHKS